MTASLHWLPVKHIIIYKIAKLTSEALIPLGDIGTCVCVCEQLAESHHMTAERPRAEATTF